MKLVTQCPNTPRFTQGAVINIGLWKWCTACEIAESGAYNWNSCLNGNTHCQGFFLSASRALKPNSTLIKMGHPLSWHTSSNLDGTFLKALISPHVTSIPWGKWGVSTTCRPFLLKRYISLDIIGIRNVTNYTVDVIAKKFKGGVESKYPGQV